MEKKIRRKILFFFSAFVFFVGCIFLVYFYLTSFSLSHQKKITKSLNRGNFYSHGRIDNSKQNIKRILDFSFAKQNSVYFSSQEIYSPVNALNTYSFVYFKTDNEKVIPTFEEIVLSSIKSEELKSKGHELMKKAVESKNNELAQEAAGMLIEADRQLTQEDRFYTVEISKDTCMPPIVLFHAGIPEWIITRNQALEMAEEYFKEPAEIAKIERNVIGTHLIYVTVNSKGDTAFIDPRNNKIYSVRIKVQPKSSTQKNDPLEEENRRERITAQWMDFQINGFDLTTFSLEGLKDLDKIKK